MTVARIPLPRKTKRTRRTNRLTTAAPDEGLTGFVHGLKASKDEERTAISLRAIRLGFTFQQDLKVRTQLEKKSIDFLVHTKPRPTPLEVQGFIGHGTASQKAADELRRTIIDNETRGTWERVKFVTYEHTYDQERLNTEIRRLFRN